MSKKIALLNGCSNYKRSENNLLGPRFDVDRWAELLSRFHGFDVVTATDKDTSRASIIAKTWEVVNKHLEDDGILVWLWSGHGYRVVERLENGRKKLIQAIAPWDTDFNDSNFQHYLTRDLKRDLTPPPGRKATIVAILDSCFSGDALRSFGDTTLCPYKPKGISSPHDDQEGSTVVFRSFGEALQSSGPHILTLAACQDNQTAADIQNLSGQGPGGAFSFSLQEALRTDRYSLKNSWKGIVEEATQWLENEGYDQVPKLTGPNWKFDESAFILKDAVPEVF